MHSSQQDKKKINTDQLIDLLHKDKAQFLSEIEQQHQPDVDFDSYRLLTTTMQLNDFDLLVTLIEKKPALISVKYRDNYGHPQNIFAHLLGKRISNEEQGKKNLELLERLLKINYSELTKVLVTCNSHGESVLYQAIALYQKYKSEEKNYRQETIKKILAAYQNQKHPNPEQEVAYQKELVTCFGLIQKVLSVTELIQLLIDHLSIPYFIDFFKTLHSKNNNETLEIISNRTNFQIDSEHLQAILSCLHTTYFLVLARSSQKNKYFNAIVDRINAFDQQDKIKIYTFIENNFKEFHLQSIPQDTLMLLLQLKIQNNINIDELDDMHENELLQRNLFLKPNVDASQLLAAATQFNDFDLLITLIEKNPLLVSVQYQSSNGRPGNIFHHLLAEKTSSIELFERLLKINHSELAKAFLNCNSSNESILLQAIVLYHHSVYSRVSSDEKNYKQKTIKNILVALQNPSNSVPATELQTALIKCFDYISGTSSLAELSQIMIDHLSLHYFIEFFKTLCQRPYQALSLLSEFTRYQIDREHIQSILPVLYTLFCQSNLGNEYTNAFVNRIKEFSQEDKIIIYKFILNHFQDPDYKITSKSIIKILLALTVQCKIDIHSVSDISEEVKKLLHRNLLDSASSIIEPADTESNFIYLVKYYKNSGLYQENIDYYKIEYKYFLSVMMPSKNVGLSSLKKVISALEILDDCLPFIELPSYFIKAILVNFNVTSNKTIHDLLERLLKLKIKSNIFLDVINSKQNILLDAISLRADSDTDQYHVDVFKFILNELFLVDPKSLKQFIDRIINQLFDRTKEAFLRSLLSTRKLGLTPSICTELQNHNKIAEALFLLDHFLFAQDNTQEESSVLNNLCIFALQTKSNALFKLISNKDIRFKQCETLSIPSTLVLTELEKNKEYIPALVKRIKTNFTLEEQLAIHDWLFDIHPMPILFLTELKCLLNFEYNDLNQEKCTILNYAIADQNWIVVATLIKYSHGNAKLYDQSNDTLISPDLTTLKTGLLALNKLNEFKHAMTLYHQMKSNFHLNSLYNCIFASESNNIFLDILQVKDNSITKILIIKKILQDCFFGYLIKDQPALALSILKNLVKNNIIASFSPPKRVIAKPDYNDSSSMAFFLKEHKKHKEESEQSEKRIELFDLINEKINHILSTNPDLQHEHERRKFISKKVHALNMLIPYFERPRNTEKKKKKVGFFAFSSGFKREVAEKLIKALLRDPPASAILNSFEWAACHEEGSKLKIIIDCFDPEIRNILFPGEGNKQGLKQ